MRIHVIYASVDGTTQNAEFTCAEAPRQLKSEAGTLIFRNGPAYHGGKNILTAQFPHVTAIFTYEE